jgi:hypothetical protein
MDRKHFYCVRFSDVEYSTLHKMAGVEEVKPSEALRLALREAAQRRGLLTGDYVVELLERLVSEREHDEHSS